MVWPLPKPQKSPEKGGPYKGHKSASYFAAEAYFVRDGSDGRVVRLLDSCCVKVHKRLPDGRHGH